MSQLWIKLKVIQTIQNSSKCDEICYPEVLKQSGSILVRIALKKEKLKISKKFKSAQNEINSEFKITIFTENGGNTALVWIIL